MQLSATSQGPVDGRHTTVDDLKPSPGHPAAVPLQFLPAVVNNNQVTLSWTGAGGLEWAPTILGPWTPYAPAPSSPYSEAIVSGENRFYRLKKP